MGRQGPRVRRLNKAKKVMASSFLAVACFSEPHQGSVMTNKNHLNVFGKMLVSCGSNPKTGYYRDGFCATGPDDSGIHVVCAEVTKAFLDFSKARGNDLITPRPDSDFKGLKPGDRWCLCAARWQEAFNAGVAPPVVLEATHQKALGSLKLEDLKKSCS